MMTVPGKWFVPLFRLTKCVYLDKFQYILEIDIEILLNHSFRMKKIYRYIKSLQESYMIQSWISD